MARDRLQAWRQLARSRFTFAEYVRLEAESRVKHEFLDGVAYAMAGGTPAHAAIAMAIGAALSVQLSGRRCRVFSSDLRVRAAVTGLATYPDVTVIWGGVASDPDDASTALNPTVVIEVASPSTEGYDRGEKLAHYKTIAELREVVIAAHDRARLEVHRRGADGSWSLRVASAVGARSSRASERSSTSTRCIATRSREAAPVVPDMSAMRDGPEYHSARYTFGFWVQKSHV